MFKGKWVAAIKKESKNIQKLKRDNDEKRSRRDKKAKKGEWSLFKSIFDIQTCINITSKQALGREG